MGLPGEGRVEKRFRVAREGQTVDGRELSRQEIQDMADTYNPEHYAGRINIEHFAGWSPEPPFNAYGDIIKVEAVEEGGKLCLYNTISALPNFVAMNKNGQKIFPSIEFYRNFAGTNKAYQVGLGMTDQPASLGTQAIRFSSNQFSLRTQPDSEIYMSLTAPTENNSVPTDQKGFLEQLKSLITPTKPTESDDEFKTVVTQGLVAVFASIKDLNEKFSALSPAPVATTTPVTTPVTQTTDQPAAAPQTVQSNPSEALGKALEPILQSLKGLETSFTQLSTTPVNLPPAAAGGDADRVDY